MGVTGLWRLIEPTGKPVPVETLENKVLAVDISIWLHQVVKGYQDAKGAPLPNAHLMGLFQRLCKLLYFRIKPVFVFDGGFPDLKKETIAKRQDNKSRYQSESERLKRELALLLSKKTAVSNILGNHISPKKGPRPDEAHGDDLFKLPVLPEKEVESESESDDEDTSSGSIVDLHSMDLESENFKKLPVKEKYDLLVELKETRKMNSWGKLHELPKKSDNFSDFQLQRLLKRRKVQECLEETEKEMGSNGMSLNDLENLLNEEGIETKIDTLPTRRIASNDSTRFLLIKNVKKQLAEARKQKLKELNKDIGSEPGPSSFADEKPEAVNLKPPKIDELDDDLQKAIQMSLECEDGQDEMKEDPNTSATSAKTDDSWTTFLSDSDYSPDSDSDEKDGFEPPDMSCAKAYIMQYSDFTHHAIDKIVTKTVSEKYQPKPQQNLNDILAELEREKSIIAAKLDVSSDEENALITCDIKKPDIKSESESECETNINEENNSPKDDVQVISKDVSVVNIDVYNSQKNVFFLDTSTDDKEKTIRFPNDSVKSDINVTLSEDITAETESSDDDFEEVTDVKESNEPVVELTLNVGEAPADDIFADVFSEIAKMKENQNAKLETIITSTKNVDTEKVICTEKNTLKKQVSKQNTVQYAIATKSCSMEVIDNQSNVPINSKTAQEVHAADDNEKLETISKSNINPGANVKVVETVNNTYSLDNTASLGNTKKLPETLREPISTDQLNTMVEEIQNEERDLLQEKGRLDRIGRNITEQMTKEAQELLQVFGIPYIVAPMEAEAQCAFLERVNLTDGTITDDSDIWLFGGKTVYKNFFNQKKHVLQFLSDRIEKSFNLSREQLILLALLVGSDYTTGVAGVGPVTAMEILASFPFNKKQWHSETTKQARQAQLVAGLQEFKKWVRSGKRTDDTSLKKKLKNVAITDDFPSVRVVQAYLEPNVEKSEDKFSWGELDITILRDYTKAKFGWSQSKLDEILKPVLKRLQDRQTQKTLQDYFKRKVDFQSLDGQMSKRVKAAVYKMGPETQICMQELPDSAPAKPSRRTLKAKNTTKNDNTEGETSRSTKAPSRSKANRKIDNDIFSNVVKVKSVNDEEAKSVIDVKINKTDRFQEVIPQREKDKQGLLQNKMKAIEIFRKTKLDRKRNPKRRRVNLPKEKAELSESDSD